MSTNATVTFLTGATAVVGDVADRLAQKGIHAMAIPSAEALWKNAPDRGAGCIVLDDDLPGFDGVKFQRELRASGLVTPQVVVSQGATPDRVVQYLKQGALTVLTKTASVDELVQAIESAVEKSRRWLDVAERISTLTSCEQSLDGREQQVSNSIVQGMPNKTIARHLAVSLRTVENIRARVLKKYGVETAAELAAKKTELRVLAEMVTLCCPWPAARAAGEDGDFMALAS